VPSQKTKKCPSRRQFIIVGGASLSVLPFYFSTPHWVGKFMHKFCPVHFRGAKTYISEYCQFAFSLFGDGQLSLHSPQITALFLDDITKCQPTHLLEIGTGAGGNAREILSKMSSTQYIGVEPQGLLVKTMLNDMPASLSPRTQIIQDTFPTSKIRSESVDFVFSKDALICIEPTIKFYTQLEKVMKLGSSGVFINYYVDEKHLTGRLPSELATWCEIQNVEYFFTSPEQQKLFLQTSGLTVETITDHSDLYLDEIINVISNTQANKKQMSDKFGIKVVDTYMRLNSLEQVLITKGILKIKKFKFSKPA